MSESVWEDRLVTEAQAEAFAAEASANALERTVVVRDLLSFPASIKVRGIFFEGLSRTVAAATGPRVVQDLVQRAGVPSKTFAFSTYAHRDFYKLYYLAARRMNPTMSLDAALRRTAQHFFPIFRESLLGRTMNALMGDNPEKLLPLLAKAYNISVQGNEHSCEIAGKGEAVWRCQVEPVAWYTQIFSGIIEGAMPAGVQAQVSVAEHTPQKPLHRYVLRIRF